MNIAMRAGNQLKKGYFWLVSGIAVGIVEG
jgi:hypothetical protein